MLAIRGLDTEETSEEEKVDFKVGVDTGEVAFETEDVADETIGTAECWVDSCSDTYVSLVNMKPEVVVNLILTN